MKRIINGRLYDTQTAVCIGSYESGGSCRDFHYFEESLYRTPKGAYFIAGSGGPMSGYARAVGQNEWTGGEDIRPLDPDEARAWAERHLPADETLAEFGAAVVPA